MKRTVLFNGDDGSIVATGPVAEGDFIGFMVGEGQKVSIVDFPEDLSIDEILGYHKTHRVASDGADVTLEAVL